MRLALLVKGPEDDREVALDAGGGELTLGRDSTADIQLHDPDRFISRRHVALRIVGDEVELRVVSAVNATETSRGTVRPGERVRLREADHFVLGAYTVQVRADRPVGGQAAPPELLAVQPSADAARDIFSGLFDREIAPGHPADPAAIPSVPAAVGSAFAHANVDRWLNQGHEEDGLVDGDDVGTGLDDSQLVTPTGESPIDVWKTPHLTARDQGPETRSAPIWSSSPPPASAGEVPAATLRADVTKSAPARSPELWEAFVNGLGLPSSYQIDEQTAKHAGAMIRLLVEGLVELLKARKTIRKGIGATDRTELMGHSNNALKLDLSMSELVQYLFSPHTGGGYMPAAQALRESIHELQVHEHSTLTAARAMLEGALREFDPTVLRSELHTEGRRFPIGLLQDARAWRAYEALYEARVSNFGDWLQKAFERHFTPTYVRESGRTNSLRAGPSEADPG